MTIDIAANDARAPDAGAPVVVRFADPMLAFGVAMHFLATQPGFGDFPARALAATIDGQIRRGHYRVVTQGARITGYAGWARVDRATADGIIAGGESPRNDRLAALADTGDIVWLTTLSTSTRAAIRALRREMRAANPGRELFGIRHGDNGRRVLERLRFAA
jgi:hemolysin-activating ACP:hemolysin acyltransferase